MEAVAAQEWFLRKHEDGSVFGPMPFAQLARWASSAVAISMNPKPRDCPENLSVITEADSTVPHWAKYSRNVSPVVE